MSAYDEDTAVKPTSDGRYAGTVSNRWDIAGAPNGGYLLAMMLNAATNEMSHPDPLTATAHYLSRTRSGEACTISVEEIRTGRRYSTAAISLFQGDKERIRALATYGDLGSAEGPTDVVGSMPDVAAPEEIAPIQGGVGPFEIANRFDYRTRSALSYLTAGDPVPEDLEPSFTGWIRFNDGREASLTSLALFADAFPPAVFNRRPFSWVPTLELTVHFRARPAPGWLLSRFSTNYLIDGLLEEDGEIWDSSGNLVALSRQFAQIT
ncbi:MAG: thioesterase family protein [Acidimicrobiia bacterium]|nr:thioesterase family protein [Acidimicrobiia bacterium]NNF65212.1 thioesterase family protein [Acidimicrobiia bacterium]